MNINNPATQQNTLVKIMTKPIRPDVLAYLQQGFAKC